jgi:ABC-type nickel/cobalt efflux system permease component RcnA
MLSIFLPNRLLTMVSTVLILAFAAAGLCRAQEAIPAGHQHPSGLEQQRGRATTKAARAPKRQRQPVEHASDASHGANHAGMPSTRHEGTPATGAHGHDDSHHMQMKGFFGSYPMTREGSGTSWLPDSTPHEGVHVTAEDWMLMAHGLFNGVYDKQGGPRGGEKAFASGMLMGMAQPRRQQEGVAAAAHERVR